MLAFRCITRTACSSLARPISYYASNPSECLLLQLPAGLVSTEWVFNRLGSVKILDTTRHITPKKNAKNEFLNKRLPNAQYLDLLQLCTAQGQLLKTLPTEAQFKEAMEALGISDTDDIVLYDSQGLYSSARVWFMFQVFNRNARVHVMNGGITRWQTEKYPIETGPVKTCEERGSFKIDENFNIVCSLADVKQRVKDYENGITKRSVVDMRRDCCFHGTCRVPIAGIPKGHIPGAVNVPFHYLTDPYNNYMIRNPTELRAIFEKHGVIIGEPEKMIFSCDYGLSACVGLFAMHLLGRPLDSCAVFDGSWIEYALDKDTKKEL